MRRWVPALVVLTGCNENNLSEVRLDAIAVVLGDFDDMRTTLVSMDIASEPFDGFIVQATYEPEESRTRRGDLQASVEALLADTSGELDLDRFNAVFVNSGTRGLGAWQYNDMIEPDDGLLVDPALQVTCDFADGGGTLVVSDWAYDLVQYCWPDAIQFYGDGTPDAAQVGIADTDLLATVRDEGLKKELGEVLTISQNYTAWAVIEGVGADTEVLLSADVEYQPSSTELPEPLAGAPLLVRFPAGRSGQVVFSTFHWNAQNPSVARGLLLGTVEGIYEGAGTASAGDTAGGEL